MSASVTTPVSTAVSAPVSTAVVRAVELGEAHEATAVGYGS